MRIARTAPSLPEEGKRRGHATGRHNSVIGVRQRWLGSCQHPTTTGSVPSGGSACRRRQILAGYPRPRRPRPARRVCRPDTSGRKKVRRRQPLAQPSASRLKQAGTRADPRRTAQIRNPTALQLPAGSPGPLTRRLNTASPRTRSRPLPAAPSGRSAHRRGGGCRSVLTMPDTPLPVCGLQPCSPRFRIAPVLGGPPLSRGRLLQYVHLSTAVPGCQYPRAGDFSILVRFACGTVRPRHPVGRPARLRPRAGPFPNLGCRATVPATIPPARRFRRSARSARRGFHRRARPRSAA